MSIQVIGNMQDSTNSLPEREVNGSKSKDDSGDKGKIGSIYAGTLNLIGADEMGSIKAKANKEAMKAILSQYSSDKEIDDELEGRRNHQKELQAEMEAANKEAARLDDKKKALKESFGIEDNSQEQKDLNLREKLGRITNGSGEDLTKEEMEQLKNMGPVTEYQKAAMELNDMIDHFSKIGKDAKKEIIKENAYIRAIQKEVLKYHGMVDATKTADEIKESASDEVVGKLVEETKQNIDEEMEDEKEKAEKAAEKEKEKQEQIKEKEEDEEDSEKTIERLSDLQDVDSDMKKAIQEIKNFAKVESILVVDTLGIAVDELV